MSVGPFFFGVWLIRNEASAGTELLPTLEARARAARTEAGHVVPFWRFIWAAVR